MSRGGREEFYQIRKRGECRGLLHGRTTGSNFVTHSLLVLRLKSSCNVKYSRQGAQRGRERERNVISGNGAVRLV